MNNTYEDQCECDECQSFFAHQRPGQDIHNEEMGFLKLAGVEVKQVDSFADALVFALND